MDFHPNRFRVRVRVSVSGFGFGFRFWVHGDSTRCEPDPLPSLGWKHLPHAFSFVIEQRQLLDKNTCGFWALYLIFGFWKNKNRFGRLTKRGYVRGPCRGRERRHGFSGCPKWICYLVVFLALPFWREQEILVHPLSWSDLNDETLTTNFIKYKNHGESKLELLAKL